LLLAFSLVEIRDLLNNFNAQQTLQERAPQYKCPRLCGRETALEHQSIRKIQKTVGHQWFTPVILATQEAEIRKMVVQSHTGQIVHEILSQT
jgi:hypothetical protein